MDPFPSTSGWNFCDECVSIKSCLLFFACLLQQKKKGTDKLVVACSLTVQLLGCQELGMDLSQAVNKLCLTFPQAHTCYI
jgi:hypothetical protein